MSDKGKFGQPVHLHQQIYSAKYKNFCKDASVKCLMVHHFCKFPEHTTRLTRVRRSGQEVPFENCKKINKNLNVDTRVYKINIFTLLSKMRALGLKTFYSLSELFKKMMTPSIFLHWLFYIF